MLNKDLASGFVAHGEISDTVAYILKQDMMQERRIKASLRYRDDMFIIAEGGNLGALSKLWKFVANHNKSSCRQIHLTRHLFSCTVRTPWLKNVFVRITPYSWSSMSCV